MDFKVNPRLEAIAKAGAPKRSDVVILRGLVAKTDKASVVVRAGLFGASAYAVSLGDIISSSDNADGSISLLVRSDAPLTIQTTAGVLQVAADNTRPPTQTEVDQCKTRMRDNCVEDRMLDGRTKAEAEQVCDGEQIAGIRDAVCRSPIAVREWLRGRTLLGAEVVSEVFG